MHPTNTQKPLTQQETQNAETILKESNLLKDALAYGKQRLLGEDNALLSNFVMFCSGRSRYPISGVVSGFSGSGKNESIRGIKPLIPKEWYFEFTTSTPEAMKYLPEEFDGTIVIYEALGVKGDSGSLSLRAIGEGESIETIYPMRNELTGKMEMGRAKTNAKNFITTSSDIDINARPLPPSPKTHHEPQHTTNQTCDGQENTGLSIPRISQKSVGNPERL